VSPADDPASSEEDGTSVDLGARFAIEPTHVLGALGRGPQPATSPTPGFTHLGRYRILGRLGRGGMGVVLHAHDPDLERELAIKLLHERSDDPTAARGRALLMREARAIAKLSHPNVIQIFDIGIHQGRVYLAMELVRGQPLQVWMREDHNLAELLAVFVRAARGLAAAHEAGLVHRDFKPPNVLVDDKLRVRVLDFGLAQPLGDPSAGDWQALLGDHAQAAATFETSIMTHGLAGTPAYMSPEQFRSAHVDERSDQFAFCVSLYEGLFGVRPFTGATLFELREAVTRAELVLPSAADRLPPELRALLRRGLACDPTLRFADMGPILEILEDLRRSLRVSDSPPLSVPLGSRRAVGADNTPSTERSGEQSKYLQTLPFGVNSHPECQMHSSGVRLVLARHPLVAAPEASPLQASLEFLSQASADDPWLPEVPARVLLAAVYEAFVGSATDWEQLWLSVGRARCMQAFVGFMGASVGPSLWVALERIWAEHHIGTTLAIESTGRGQLSVHLSYPDQLFDELGYTEVLQLIRAGLQLCGQPQFVLEGYAIDPRALRAELSYASGDERR
jgi:serine/threonine protein kinase